MTVLVPYDGSEQSKYALELATSRFADDSVLLLHIIEPFADHTEAAGYTAQRYDQEMSNAEAMLETASNSLADDVRVDTEIRYGRPIYNILRVAEDENVDQIVMGSHGREGARRLLLGSVAESVTRRASVPVTIVREPVTEDEELTHILVPFDGSDESLQALSYALDQYADREITALYVAYPPEEVTTTDSERIPDALDDWQQRLDEQTQEVLDRALEHAEANGYTISTEAVRGEPAREITEYAAEHDSDHIVMGSHGRGGLKRLLLGSVAETVTRRAPTSVTVVR